MNSFFVVISLLAGGFAKADIHSPRPEIAVSGQAEITADRPVRVMDIATVSFVSAAEAEAALNLVLLPAQADGEAKKFKNAELVHLIKNKVGANPDIADEKWTYFVPEDVELKAKKNLLSNKSVQNELTMAIQSKCFDCSVVLRDLKVPQIREAKAFDHCQIQTDSLKAGGSFIIPVQCSFGAENKTYWISGSSRISKLAPVTTRQLNPGEKITSRDFRMEEVDVTFAKDGVPKSSEVEGQLASRILSVNQPIFKSDYKKELAVTRGQLIRAISGNETFEVTSQAIAEEQGYVGDLIRIKNSESQKMLSGQIVEKGVVKVQ